jgi:hypothetical protein
MAYTLGRTFKKGGKAMRYAYRGGRRTSKMLVCKLASASKADAKRATKRIVIGGVTYLVLAGLDNLKYGGMSK